MDQASKHFVLDGVAGDNRRQAVEVMTSKTSRRQLISSTTASKPSWTRRGVERKQQRIRAFGRSGIS